MNYIQTLYISPSQNPFKDSFGWISPLYHLLSWGLSAMSLKESLGSLKLYTNEVGKELLINMLQLPYDEVVLSFEGWELPHKELWALSKIHTYSLQSKPFIHIDGDIYIFHNFNSKLCSAQLIAQNIEQFTDYYYSVMRPINRKFVYMPQYVQNDFMYQEQLKAVNAGILGGNNIDFFRAYTDEATKYVNANLSSLKDLDANRFNVFFEQHLFYKMAEAFNLNIECLLSQEYHDNAYLGLDKFYEIPSKKSWYFHLLGNYKKDIFTCQQMAKALLALYPKVYYRIIEVYSKHCQLENSNIFSFSESMTQVCNLRNTCLALFPENLSKPMEESLQRFISDVAACIESLSPSQTELRKRDEEAFFWYQQIFNEKVEHENVQICRVENIGVIHSKYDWCRLYKKCQTSGINYYASFSSKQLSEGNYTCVLIPERFTGFSIYDIDDVESTIISELKEPISFSKLRKRLEKYIEGELDVEFMRKFNLLINNALKRLILLKVIMPCHT